MTSVEVVGTQLHERAAAMAYVELQARRYALSDPVQIHGAIEAIGGRGAECAARSGFGRTRTAPPSRRSVDGSNGCSSLTDCLPSSHAPSAARELRYRGGTISGFLTLIHHGAEVSGGTIRELSLGFFQSMWGTAPARARRRGEATGIGRQRSATGRIEVGYPTGHWRLGIAERREGVPGGEPSGSSVLRGGASAPGGRKR